MYSSKVLVLTMSIFATTEALATNMKWKPDGLSIELYPIAHLESSFGKNMNHDPHSKGSWFSSYGALGLKAATAYDAYKISPRLQAKFPGLLDKDRFLTAITSDWRLYNECANLHWRILRKQTSSMEQAVFAWRWGIGAALKAGAAKIDADKYVASYGGLSIVGTK